MRNKAVAEMPNEFWRWFDERRRALDLSDRKVAQKADIASSVISKARTGDRAIGYEALIKIAHAMGSDPVIVLRMAGLLPKNGAREHDPEIDEIAHDFAQLGSEDRTEVRALVRAKLTRLERERNKRK